MNTIFLATAGLAAAADFFFVAIVTGLAALGLLIALLALRIKSLKFAVVGCIPAMPAAFFTAMGWHHAMTISPSEDIDAAGNASMWVIGLVIAVVCFIGGCLCVVKIQRRRRESALKNNR